MAEVVYLLCTVTSFACAILLFRAYRINKTGLLLWSCLAFVAFALNNILLFIDLVLVPEVDLAILRTSVLLIGFCLLLYGLIWEKR